MNQPLVDPADALFKEELYDLSYTLRCIQGYWRRAPAREYRQEALNMACRELSSKLWLYDVLSEWAKEFLNIPGRSCWSSAHYSPVSELPHQLSMESANPQSQAPHHLSPSFSRQPAPASAKHQPASLSPAPLSASHCLASLQQKTISDLLPEVSFLDQPGLQLGSHEEVWLLPTSRLLFQTDLLLILCQWIANSWFCSSVSSPADIRFWFPCGSSADCRSYILVSNPD